jgi:hypothetical protein
LPITGKAEKATQNQIFVKKKLENLLECLFDKFLDLSSEIYTVRSVNKYPKIEIKATLTIGSMISS